MSPKNKKQLYFQNFWPPENLFILHNIICIYIYYVDVVVVVVVARAVVGVVVVVVAVVVVVSC